MDFLWGRSVWEGVISLVPRAVWPGKPVFGGSGDLVPEMTGLDLDRSNTAWGVGSVMEFYVNFGVTGVICGFLLLGFILARLDSRAAGSLAVGDHGGSLVYFLPGVALVQPLGSIVELTGGAAAALLAGFAWRWIWLQLNDRDRKSRRPAPAVSMRFKPEQTSGNLNRDRPRHGGQPDVRDL